ncbi:MAG TPA: prolyl oligopeptidase family serine peptidase [Pseudonocardiaceae bacterium]|nr:prolyl oligopeptidase family serine peptidase [Pseudonocardiaceae bacterium]
MTESLPDQIHRTQRFSIGAPHDITIGPPTLFLRSGALWTQPLERMLLDNVTEYATDGKTIACVANGALHTITNEVIQQIPTPTPITNPRPQASRTAYLHNNSLHTTESNAPLATDVADFWWSPTATHLLITRRDESPVDTWYLDDPTDPASPPRAIRHAAVGKPIPIFTLAIIDLTGAETPVDFALEYLVTAGWDTRGPYAVGQTRDQRTQQFLTIDPTTGAAEVAAEQHDPCWVQRIPGLPARTAAGKLVAHLDHNGTRHLTVDGVPVTPPGLQLREVKGITDNRITFTASPQPTETHLYTYESALTQTQAPQITSTAEDPVLALNRTRLILGPRDLRADLFLPSWHQPGSNLPVLLDPYGGPGRQRVTDDGDWRNLMSQWFAEHGFAVLTIDGAGTPGRGPDWEREIHGDQFDPVLDDQIAGLHAAAQENPDLDLSRVGIRGWSFSGSIAQLAVLRRPDIFHAAVAGAGATDQRLYHAEWRERYLGQLDEHPECYDANDILAEAPNLTRPLLLMHGLSDATVHPAHTLRMSSALLAAGKPHELVLLPGVGHSAIGTAATKGILHTQLNFLTRHLNPRPNRQDPPPVYR